MPYLIGTDEAGYGPNLGPLLITATVWHLADIAPAPCEAESNSAAESSGRRRPLRKPPAADDLYHRLRGVVCRNPSRTAARRRLAIADSKALYNPAQGLDLLERGVLAVLSLLDCYPADWREIWELLDGDASSHLDRLPWHVGYQSPLPWSADRDDVVQIGGKLRRGMGEAGVRLVAIRSTAVFPERFNDCTKSCGNKAEALSQLTLKLVADALQLCAGERMTIVCDKHGGRNHYGRLLQMQFPDPLVEVHGESTAESIYRWGSEPERIEIRFRAGGEESMPAALASMVSKYLRELAMRAFNDFWCCRVPDLKPTAGYPGDSRRFKRAIAAAQTELGIADEVLWRSR